MKKKRTEGRRGRKERKEDVLKEGDKVEVKLTIEDAMGITLPEDSFAGDVITVEDAVNLVVEHV